MFTNTISALLQSYGYLAVFLLVAVDCIGVPLPAETTLIAAAAYAGSTHQLSIIVIVVVAAAAAILGDNVGYWLGATHGPRLLSRFGRYLGWGPAKVRVGRYLFAHHGASVVFYGRFVVVLRTYAAVFAGLNRMPWKRFVAVNAAGGVLWSSVVAFGAYALGGAAAAVGTAVTTVGLVVAALLTVAMIVAMKGSMRRLQQRADAEFSADTDLPATPVAVA